MDFKVTMDPIGVHPGPNYVNFLVCYSKTENVKVISPVVPEIVNPHVPLSTPRKTGKIKSS